MAIDIRVKNGRKHSNIVALSLHNMNKGRYKSLKSVKGESISSADREHLHHQLLKQTKSTAKTVLLMYAINALFACVSIFYTLGDKKLSMLLYGVLLLLFLILIFKTDILFEHTKETKKNKKKVKGKKERKK